MNNKELSFRSIHNGSNCQRRRGIHRKMIQL